MATIETPKMNIQLHVRFSSDVNTLGLHGALGAVATMLQARGQDTDPALLWGWSGAAFRAYCLLPSDNYNFDQVYPGLRHHWGALRLDNYGFMPSIGAQADIDIRYNRNLIFKEQIGLVKHEFEAGRPVALLTMAEPRRVGFVEALEINGKRTESPVPVFGDIAQSYDLSDVRSREPHPEIAALYTLRDGTDIAPHERKLKLQLDVLSFAKQHSDSFKELAHDQDIYFASGIRAFDACATVAKDAQESELNWVRVFVAQTRFARTMAAKYLGLWASALREESDDWASPAGGVQAVDLAEQAYAKVADALSDIDALEGEALASVLLAAKALEKQAVDALSGIDPRPAGFIF